MLDKIQIKKNFTLLLKPFDGLVNKSQSKPLVLSTEIKREK